MRTFVFVLVLVAFTTSAGSLWWHGQSEPAPTVVVPAEVAPEVAATAGVRGAPDARLYVNVARMFEIGYAGGVIISEDTRTSIEAAVATLSDPATEQELQAFENVLNASLPHADAHKVLALTKGYARYTGELKSELHRHGLPQTLAEFDASMARVSAIRQRHFDPPTVQALFGPHDAYARIMGEASFVEADASLSLDSRRQRLAALKAQLPEAQRSQILIPEPQR